MATPKNSGETALVPFEQFQIAQMDPDVLAEIMEANVGGDLGEFDLDRVGMPAGGATTWVIQDIEGEREAKTLTGVMVHWKEARAFWHKSFDETGGGSPPDCFSNDATIGEGDFGPGSEANPTGKCAECPMSKWGSADPTNDDNRGQACKQMRVVYLIQPDSLLPLVIVLPPTSIGAHKKFLLRLVGRATPYWGVVVNVELERQKSSQNIAYASAVWSVASKLDVEQATMMREYGKQIAGAFDNVIEVISTDDVRGNLTAEDVPA